MTRTDVLALQILPHFADGRWHPSAPDADFNEGVQTWWLNRWRTWKCIQRGWLEYQTASPDDRRPWVDRRGWLRLTIEGRLTLAIVRDISAKEGPA